MDGKETAKRKQVLEGNAFYEIDLECMRKKEEQKKKKELTSEQARILELEKQLRYAQIENAYLKELRRLRLEDARKMKEQQESLAVSEENSN